MSQPITTTPASEPPTCLAGASPTSDEALMAAYALRDDNDAFRRLFARLAPAVRGFFIRMFGPRPVAEDLLQITFLKLHRARATYRLGTPVRPWLFTIAARVRIDELRRFARHARAIPSTDTIERTATDPSGDLDALDDDRQTLRRTIRQAITDLPPSQRAVVLLHRYQEFTFKEIGTLLGVSEGAVKLRAFRAHARLRSCLEPQLRAIRDAQVQLRPQATAEQISFKQAVHV